jgi:hypothetical protein
MTLSEKEILTFDQCLKMWPQPEHYHWDRRFMRKSGDCIIKASPYRRELTIRQIEDAAKHVVSRRTPPPISPRP